METKYEELSKNLNELIDDFQKAKKRYYTIFIVLRVTTIVFSCLSTIFISLTFVKECELTFKILSVITSGVASALIATNKMIDYKGKWIQRTNTLIKLFKIKRAVKFRMNSESNPNKKDEIYDLLLSQLDEAMQDDYSLWEATTDNDN